MAADTYLRQKISDAVKVRMDTLRRPEYHFTPVLVTSAPDDLPALPDSPLTVYVKVGKEEIRQDLASRTDNSKMDVMVAVTETDYSDADERHTEHAGDVRKAMGIDLSVTDQNGVTLSLEIWCRGVDVWNNNGQLVTEIYFEIQYESPSARPAVF